MKELESLPTTDHPSRIVIDRTAGNTTVVLLHEPVEFIDGISCQENVGRTESSRKGVAYGPLRTFTWTTTLWR